MLGLWVDLDAWLFIGHVASSIADRVYPLLHRWDDGVIDSADPLPRLDGVGPRAWAAIGNVFRISAVVGYLLCAVFASRAVELQQQRAPASPILAQAGGAVLFLVAAILLWNLKGPLIRGNLLVQLLAGAYMILWVISTLGLGLILIGIVYLFTGQPDDSYFHGKQRPPRQRFKRPSDWRPTGRVGPSGATFYSDANRAAACGIFNSSTPVQVTDRRNGYANVVTELGEGGWIDLRTLAEGGV